MKNSQKKASESIAVQTKMVLPNDTNPLNTLFGGRLLEWMDEIASISAHKHCGRVVVTASINNVSFNEPIFARNHWWRVFISPHRYMSLVYSNVSLVEKELRNKQLRIMDQLP